VTWKTSCVLILVCLLVVAAALGRNWLRVRSHPNALWHVVHDLCVPDERANHLPAPCASVDLARGFAVLKDEAGRTQVLVIPTAKVTGIEDPLVLAPTAPNYWEEAWESRSFVAKNAGRPIPREDFALAVNSVEGRSQDQLHIHVDCVRPEAKTKLAAHLGELGPTWRTLDFDIRYRPYRARWIAGTDLGDVNPFKLLAADPRRAPMADETLVLIPMTGADGAPGFALLSDHTSNEHLADGHGEVLLDHNCRVLQGAG